ncbi:hypothetical protein U717_04410 [Rhodobacter capsulatus R121]|nr:hypothetical protein U714_04405 [Rhodobacter capsulatus DE442]ETD79066.1 hypothetical protein U717_04410 [Rhodobacter capsulatus R121]ETE54981.1 hypothetical protein U715_04400 [Rhodobacter capsulatus Y262]
MDEYGHGYPLVDALTLESHGIDMGEREIEHIADCIIAAITSRPEAEIRAEALREAPEVTALVEALRKIRQATLPIYDDAALDATTVRKAAEIARAALAKWEAANG